MHGPAKPIFVIGMNRSGTKWLSNLIANHPDVAAVQHADHTGILETNAFDAWSRKFPDLSAPDEFVALVEAFTRSDFFRTTGLPDDFCYRLEPRPRDPIALFGALMDAHARNEGKACWLQKLAPWFAEPARERFPGARFVVIERDRLEVLRSTHFLATGGRTPISGRTIASHHLQERVLAGLRREGAVAVRYADLQADPGRELQRVCGALGLAFEPALLELPWERNTSFASDEARRFALSPAELRRIRGLGRLLDALPDGALAALRRLLPPPPPTLVGGTYRRLRAERGVD